MSIASFPSRWRQIANHTLDILLPPLCLSCDKPVGTDRTLCTDCWKDIHFITPSFCACCGAPFEVPVGDNMLCGSCIGEPPHFAKARAAMLYNDASKRLVLSFKHSDRTHPARALAEWMHRAGQEFWSDADLVMPVPLHRWRLFKRRYNQSALLAHYVGAVAIKPVLVDGLQRLRPTPTQGHLSRKERFENVRGAFGLVARYQGQIKDKNIVLIDDVLTTGATANECARVLLKAGAKAVNVLTLSRVRPLVS